MLDRLDDTIVAISSAPGRGPVGIVRLSGPKAIAVADRMFEPAEGEPLHLRPGSMRFSGEIRAEPQVSLPTVLYLFRAPHSRSASARASFNAAITSTRPPLAASAHASAESTVMRTLHSPRSAGGPCSTQNARDFS